MHHVTKAYLTGFFLCLLIIGLLWHRAPTAWPYWLVFGISLFVAFYYLIKQEKKRGKK